MSDVVAIAGINITKLLEAVEKPDRLVEAEMLTRVYIWKEMTKMVNEEFGDSCWRVTWLFNREFDYPHPEIAIHFDKDGNQMPIDKDLWVNAFFNWGIRNKQNKHTLQLMMAYNIGVWDRREIEVLDDQIFKIEESITK